MKKKRGTVRRTAKEIRAMRRRGEAVPTLPGSMQ